MLKRASISILVMAMLVLAACDQAPTPTANPVSEADMSTLVALATSVAAASEAAPSAEAQQQPTAAEASPVEQPATHTPVPASITVTGATETAAGKITVFWDAIGDFPSGFKVVWTDVQGLPTFPENTNLYVNDANARSATIGVETGKIYYLRVCRFTGDGCDTYSNLWIFALQLTELTPQGTATQGAAATATKTPKPVTGATATSSKVIKILEMKGGEDGKAYIKWQSSYNPSAGFKIVYSTSNQTPTYGTDPYFYISKNTTREAWVDGVQGTTYYYRICGYTGSVCEVYSPTYTYKFPGNTPTPKPSATPDGSTLSITSIADSAPGAVQVTWSASGSFPNGYKVVYSQTNPLPTMADGYVYVDNESTHTAVVSGLEPGKQYYFRVCKYYGGNCTIYSAASTFTVAAAAEESGFTLSEVSNVVGSVEIAWSISSNSANGYKVLMSATEPVPADAYLALVSDPATHNYVDASTPEGTVYYRVCRWSGSWCLSYSNTLAVTITAAP